MSEGQGPPQSPRGASQAPGLAGSVSPAAPAGWYPDPARPDQLRWWNGTTWTGHIVASGGPAAGRPRAEGPFDGLAVASLVLGIVGVFIVAIPLGFVALRRTHRSADRRRGGGLATAGVVLGFGWILIFAVGGVLAAAGLFDEETDAERFTGEEVEVAAVIDEFDAALANSRFEHLCDELLAPQLEARLAANVGKSCEEFYIGIEERRGYFHSIEIVQLTVRGTVALVRTKEGGTRALVTLVERDSRWRIAAIR